MTLTGKELAKVTNGPGEKTKKMLADARPYLIGALPMAPIVAEEAQGAVIKDVEGDLYIDLFAGVGVLSPLRAEYWGIIYFLSRESTPSG